jgi:hypothetical protein
MTASISITATNTATVVIDSIKKALDNLVSGGPYRVDVLAKVRTNGGLN